MRYSLLLLWIFMAGSVYSQEICDNEIDDDNDGLVDQYDPDCPCNPDLDNFYGLCTPTCEYVPPPGSAGFDFAVQWTGSDQVTNIASLFTGDLDGDGIPEIVTMRAINYHSSDTSLIYVLNGEDGSLRYHPSTIRMHNRNKGIAIGDVDRDGRGEIFYVAANDAGTNARRIVCYEYDPAGSKISGSGTGGFTLQWTSNTQVTGGLSGADLFSAEDFAVNLADFNYDGIPEVYVANEIYNATTGTRIATGGTNSIGSWNLNFQTDFHVNSNVVAVDVLPDGFCANCTGLELVAGNQVYSVNIGTGSMNVEVTAPIGLRDGSTGIADYDLDGDLDGIIGTTDGSGSYIYVWDLQTSTQIGNTHTVNDASSLSYHPIGTPTVADFDGDNRPEIAVCGNLVMQVIEDHTVNIGGLGGVAWSIVTTDNSGQTGVAIFDFNGDGVSEVVYRDESELRMMNGTTGANLATIACGSGTGGEYAVVADIDDDGETEVICNCSGTPGSSNAAAVTTAFRSDNYPWVPTRKVWNQYSYFVVNVNDDLTIPFQQQSHHIIASPALGTTGPLNTYLKQASPYDNNGNPVFPAGNLEVIIDNIDVSQCLSSDQLLVFVTMTNTGNLNMPAGIPVAFYGDDPEANSVSPLLIESTTQPLRKDSTIQEVFVVDISSVTPPFDLYVVGNDDGTLATPYSLANDFPITHIGECDFVNNKVSANVGTCTPNSPPIAVNDTLSTPLNTPVSGDASVNDSDPDGNLLVFDDISSPSNGSVTFNDDGTFTYTPNTNFTGTDQFDYQVCEIIMGGTSTQSVPSTDVGQTISSAGANTVTSTLTVASGGTISDLNVIGLDVTHSWVSDLSITLQSPSGTIVSLFANSCGNNANINLSLDDEAGSAIPCPPTGGGTHMPAGSLAAFDGENSTGTWTLTVSDGASGDGGSLNGWGIQIEESAGMTTGLCDTATVYITVQGSNDPPLAINDINNTLVNTPVGGNVLTNDSDPNGDNITVNTTPISNPTNGSVTLNPDGTYTYTPDPNFVGTDQFQYAICDDGTPGPLCDTATVTIEIRENTIANNPPVANDDATSTQVGTPVTSDLISNDGDPDGDDITVNTTPVVDPTNGSVVINPDGTFTYTPDPGFEGDDSFDYVICDDGTPSLCDTATVTITVVPDNNSPANDPPVAGDDAGLTPQDTPVGGDLLANDNDPNGDNISVNTTPITTPTNGSVVINPDGTYTYTPDSAYTGPDQFTYSICDDGTPSLCDTATVYLTVFPSNDPPLAINDINNTLVNTPVGGNVLTNDSDPNLGDNITVNTTPISNPTNGSVTLNPDGTYTYTPDPNFVGTDQFQYAICDDGTPGPLCDTATVTIEIRENTIANNPPVANDDATSTQVGTPVTSDLISNDGDPDGDDITVNTTPVVDPTNGTVVINPDGTFTYTPDPGFEGDDSFDYVICDDGTPSLCDTATVTITVVPDNNGSDNDPPIAGDDAGLTPQDTPVGGDLLANDNDPNGDNISVNTTPITTPTNGSVVINPDGTYTYTPDSAYTGPDQFTYSICDDGTPSLCDTATVYLTVFPSNDPPLAINDINNTLVNTPVGGNVLTNDSDPNGDNITVNTTPISNPTNGSVTLNPDGTYTYTPDPNFVGTDQFQYAICDDGTPGPLCDTATVTIEIRENTIANNPPVANDDATSTQVGTPVTSDLISNDGDPDGDDITVNTTPVVDPTNGTVVINPDGTFTYTPDPGFEGDDSFDYVICDDGTPSLCDTATVKITVVPDNNGSDNDPPVAGDDAGLTPQDTPVGGDLLANDNDPNGDNISVNTTPITTPTNGSVVINPDGTYTYTPDSAYTGPDQFTYSICDDGTPSLCDTATVYLTVFPSNDPPLAINDINNTLVNTPVGGNVLTNDSDPNLGDNITVNTTPISNPTNGSVSLNPDGTYTYTPDPNFVGTDQFQYAICDDGTPGPLCDTATVTIEIRENTVVNNPPVANDDATGTQVGNPVTGDLISNDGDPDGDDITVNTTPVVDPTNGTVVINPDGTFTYTPDPGFEGDDSFDYVICDDGTPSLCDTATVTITVVPDDNGSDNDPPIAGDDAGLTPQDTPVGGDLLANDNDPNGDNISVNTTPITTPTNGSVVINPDGTYTYTPDSAYTGPDQFTYSICDDGTPSLCDTATVYLTVFPSNDPPLAINDINNTLVNTPVGGNVLTNDSDPNLGDNITVNTTPISNPTNGSVTLNPDGTYTYTPDPNFVGTDQFQYAICDDGTPGPLCDTATVTIEIRENTVVNNPPVANDDATGTQVGNPVTGDLISNDGDPDGDDITVNTTPVVDPTNGTVVINPDGTFTYTPDPSFEGDDSFDYVICDDGTPSLCDTATVTITVVPDNNGSDNDPPIAGDDAGLTPQDTPIGGDLLANDNDPNGDNISVNTTPITTPSNGSVVINPDGTYTYTPDSAYTGPDQFTYSICDDGTPSLCDTATVYLTVFPSNDPPLAINDINNTLVNTPVGGNVLTNDSDPNLGDNITVNTTPISNPTNGSVTLNPDGTYTYTPDPNFVGTDQFQYAICDDGTPGPLCDTATVTIEIRENTVVNNPPVANDDATGTQVGNPVTGDLISNDGDPDGDDITVNTTPVVDPTNGTVVINPDGTFTYTPDPGFEGDDSFDYVICDDGTPSLCDTATVTITVVPDDNGSDNDPPIAGDDAGLTPQDTPVGGDLLANDNDPNGDNISVNTTPITTPTNGSVIINPDGTYTYTPDSAYTGPDQFTYSICDDGTPSLCDTATVYLTVFPSNDPPLAINDINNTLVNTPVGGNVLTNDSDPNLGDNITVNTTPISNPSNGSVSLNPDGTYTYTPDPNFVGTDQFQYAICDDGTPGPLCDTATVTIEIRDNTTGTNDPPIANDDATSTPADSSVTGNLLTNDGDPDGDDITVNTTPVVDPTNGTVVINPDGTFTYTPDPGFTGDDSFDYVICDDGTPSLCDTATVTITVVPDDNGPANDPPVAGDDAGFSQMNDPINGDLLANDYDPNGDNITVNTTPVTNPTNGSVVINPDGTYTYTPNQGYVGPDQFTYVICDDGTPILCDTATVYLTVYPKDFPPLAVNDLNLTLVNTPVGGNVLTNDISFDGDSIVANPTPVSNPSNGTVTLNPDGSYVYTPNTDFVGIDVFTYQVCDFGSTILCDIATVTITIVEPTIGNNPPVANDDATVTQVGTPITSTLLNNDSDPDGDSLIVNTTPVVDPTNGTVVINPDGTYTYTPNPGFEGDDTFDYVICDDATPSLCDTATVTVTVIPDDNGPANDPPFAGDDAYITLVDVPVSGNVLPNDGDVNGDNIILNTTPIVDVANGSVVLNPDGSFTYTPNPGYTGPDQFVYEICDDGTPSLCAQATVYLTVLPVNDPPLAINDINNTLVNTPVGGSVLTNDSDPNGDNITVNTTPISNPSNGTVILNPDGTYIYTPNTDFVGTDQFDYVICDDGTPGPLCDTATVTIEIRDNTLNNDPPIANDDATGTQTGNPVTGDLISNDGDPNGDDITVNTTPVVDPTNGTVVINPDGTFTYTPDPGFTGDDSFDYVICDDGTPSLCDTATVTITVTPNDNGPANDPPIAGDDAGMTPQDTPVSGDLLANDNDPNGDNITVNTTPVSTTSNGSVVINPDGTYTYTPNAGYTGPDQFTYVICDDGTPVLCDTATVYITVFPTNDPPLAINDINNTLMNLPVSGNVLTNDSDPNVGDNITVNTTPFVAPSFGNVVLNPDGTYTYTPFTSFVGTDQFQYIICDDGTPGPLCDTATVTIEIRNNSFANDPPVANDDASTTLVNTPVVGNLLANDGDPDGDNIQVNTIPVMDPASGTVSINPDGTYTYFPNPGFVGTDTFTYVICDDGTPSLCDTADVVITVLPDDNGPANDPPFAGDDASFTLIDQPVSGTTLDNDWDPNGDNIIFNTTLVTQPTNGSVVVNPDGTYTYTPNAGFTGNDQFIYQICDDGTPSLCATATVYITVYPQDNTFPVEWLDFNAELVGHDAALEWSTASESNSDKFIVERSLDGTLFELLNPSVQAAGNSSTINTYNFVDPDVVTFNVRRVYYRIKQVDFDGSFSYSNIVELTLPEPELQTQLLVYPNPAHDFVNLQILTTDESSLEIDLLDITGKLVWEKTVTNNSNRFETEIPLLDLARGVYFVRVQTDKTAETVRLIVE